MGHRQAVIQGVMAVTVVTRTVARRSPVPTTMSRILSITCAVVLLVLAVVVNAFGFLVVAGVFIVASLFSGWAADSSPLVCLGHSAECGCDTDVSWPQPSVLSRAS